MTHKQFRSSISKRDPAARKQFNSAAAVEARLRAVQLMQTLATESACTESRDVPAALDRLAEDQYEQHLKLMQRTNSLYQQHQKLLQVSLEAELPPPLPPTRHVGFFAGGGEGLEAALS